MARKGKDLFELLQSRSRGAPATRRRSRSGADWWASVQDFFERWTPRAARSGRGGGRGSGRRASAVPWLVPVIGVLGLGAGFLLGRATTAQAKSTEALQTSAGPERPTVFPTAGDGSSASATAELSRDEEEARLAGQALVFQVWEEPYRATAAAVSRYLRQQGLDTARIRLMKNRRTGASLWAVLVYVPLKEEADRYLSRLQAVPAMPGLGWWDAAMAKLDSRLTLID